jgi:tRNA-splicing ligase RtcB
MPVQMTRQSTHAEVKVWTTDVDPQTLSQLERTASLPIIAGHLAAMPDVHLGIGATVGSVLATRRAIIPAAVGVDIGCGVIAVDTGLAATALPDALGPVRRDIETAIPLGAGAQHSRPSLEPEGAGQVGLVERLQRILQRHPKILQGARNRDAWAYQVGTLGAGNHFIELCLDERQRVWVMLHSGSRGIGNRIGSYFIERARERAQRNDLHLPDRDLAYLVEDDDDQGRAVFTEYLVALEWAQEYAALNRQHMLRAVLKVLRRHVPTLPAATDARAIDCHHNYVARERHFGESLYVTRKGAIRARKGDLGLIPGSMGARSFVVRGKGEPESLCSCAHGAGRQLSRRAAKRAFTVADLKAQTAGVECRKDAGVLDEIPAAYKDIDRVMENQSDLLEVVHTLKQIINVKG